MSFQDTIRTCAPVRLPSAPVARQQERKGKSGRPTRFKSALWEPRRHRPSSSHPLHRTRLKRLATTTRRQPVKLLPCHSVCIFDFIWPSILLVASLVLTSIKHANQSPLFFFPIGRSPIRHHAGRTSDLNGANEPSLAALQTHMHSILSHAKSSTSRQSRGSDDSPNADHRHMSASQQVKSQ